MQPMTDATGRSFLSYRRTRINEARLLIEAQHEVGIPTWQDLTELEEGHTEEQLRSALADPATANAVVWLTPDVETSTVITRVELPAIVARMEVKDRFFMIPVAAGGPPHCCHQYRGVFPWTARSRAVERAEGLGQPLRRR